MEFTSFDQTLIASIPASILELGERIVSMTALQSSLLCQRALECLRTGSMISLPQCNCNNCVTVAQVLQFDGIFIPLTDGMTDSEYEECLRIEQGTVLKNFDDLPENPVKNLLRGKIYANEENYILAAEAFRIAYSEGIVNALSLYGKMLAEQAKNTGETAPEMYGFEACVAFFVAMCYIPFARVFLLRLLLPYLNITRGSINTLHKEIADSAIQEWVRQNESKITRCLQNLLNKQAETVCPHVWREIPSDNPIPNPEAPDTSYALFCEMCGKNRI